MPTALRRLCLSLCAFSLFVLCPHGANAATTVTFSTTDNASFGTATLHDGDFGSANLPGIVINFFTGDSGGAANGSTLTYDATDPANKGVTGDIFFGDPTFVIKRASGTGSFWLKGFLATDPQDSVHQIKIEGFLLGSSTGAPVTVTIGVTFAKTLTTSDLLPARFQNVDEVRISNPAGGNLYNDFNSFVFDDPVLPNAAPVVTTSGGISSFVEGQNVGSMPVVVDAGVTVTDSDNTTLASGSASITGNFQSGQDTLQFANDGSTMGNVSGSYNAGTGVLTLTSAGATATLAQWQAALRAVTYTDTSDTPNTSTRTVSFAVNDGVAPSSAGTKQISVTSADDNPSATGLPTDVIAAEDVASNFDLSAITLSDPDAASGSLTLTLTASGGTFTASTGGGVTVAQSGTGTLVLSGTLANLNAFLDAAANIKYTGASNIFGNDAATVAVKINDNGNTGGGGGGDVALGTVNVDISPANDAPAFGNLNGAPNFVEGGSAVTLDSDATVSDLDLGAAFTGASLTVARNGGANSSDVFSFDTLGALFTVSGGNLQSGGLTFASFTSSGGTLTVNFTSSGTTATPALVDDVLQHIQYQDTSDAPPASAQLTWTFHDGNSGGQGSGGDLTAIGATTVSITAVNDAPSVSGLPDNLTFAEDTTSAFQLNLDTNEFTDPDSSNLTVTLAVTAGTIGLANPGGSLTQVDGNGTGTVILGGTLGNVNAYFGIPTNITWTPPANVAGSGAATLTITANDGNGSGDVPLGTVALDLSAVNDVPVVTTTGGSASFVEGQNVSATPVVVDAGVTVSDLDNATLASATVSITGNFHSGEDVLDFTNDGSTMGNITSSFDAGTGVLTLTSAGATATTAQWQAALRAVTYTDNSDTPDTSTRTIGFAANDGSGTSDAGTKSVGVTSSDDPPVLAASGGPTAFTEGKNVASTPVAVDAGITVGDVDNATLASGTVSITAGFRPGEDVLAFTNTNPVSFGNISASYNSGTGVLTLTSSGATATLAKWQEVLRAVTYTDTSDQPDTSPRTISFVANDGTADGVPVTKEIQVAGTNDAPQLTTSGGSTAFVEASGSGATPVVIDPGLTISDGDNPTLASATAAITGGFQSAEDVLSFTNNAGTMGNIAGSYDADTGVLTLTSASATATLAEWQAALRAVTYADASDTPDTAARTVTFVASDGTDESVAATKSVTLTSTNDAPVGTIPGTIAVIQGNASPITGLSFADPDAATNTVTVTLAVDSGTLTATSGGGVTVAGSGTTTLTLSGAVATIDAFIAGANVTFTSAGSSTADVTLTTSIDDGGHTGAGGAQSDSGTTTLTVADATLPRVSGMLRLVPATVNTSVTTLKWEVTFSENVSGVDAGDFALSPVGGNATGSIGSVEPVSGSVYDVTADAIAGQGGLRLVLKSSGTGIVDGANNPIADGFDVGDFYIVGIPSVFDTTTLAAGAALAVSSGTPGSMVAQRFTTSGVPQSLTTVGVELGNIVGSPVPVVTLHTDDGVGGIDANVIATMTNIGGFGINRFVVFTTSQVLSPNTTYWVVFSDGAAGGTSYEVESSLDAAGGSGAWLTAGDHVYRHGVSAGSTQAGALQMAIGATSVPAITSTLTASATYGTAFAGYAVTASNGPTSFGATGLPAGLALNAATGAITGTPTQAGEFNVALTATNGSGTGPASTLVLTVAKAPLTVKAQNATRAYGASNPTLGVSYSGFVGSDGPGSLTTAPTASTNANAGSAAGTYAITASGGVSSDYAFAYVDGTLTVTKAAQTITFGEPADSSLGNTVALSATATSGLAVGFSIVSGPATLSGSTVSFTGTGLVIVRATQAGDGNYLAATSVERGFLVTAGPVADVSTPTSAPAPSVGEDVELTVTATPGVSYQWQRNGVDLAGETSPSLQLTDVQPPAAGLYTYTASTTAGEGTSQPVIVGLATEEKVVGKGKIVDANVATPSGVSCDQLLLDGEAAAMTADPAKVTRIGFVDLSGDIVRVEFSGAGSLSVVMDDASAPAPAADYNQPDVNYVQGHVGIVITGANETSNLSVVSIGRITAVNQSLFRDDVDYDGVADIAFVAIQSANGKFGGVRTGNVDYVATTGFAGVYAPGVTFTGPVNVGDIHAYDTARPLLVVGSADHVRIAGGNLEQPNDEAVTVGGMTPITFAPGTTSQGDPLPPQANHAQFVHDGIDVTDMIVAGP